MQRRPHRIRSRRNYPYGELLQVHRRRLRATGAIRQPVTATELAGQRASVQRALFECGLATGVQHPAARHWLMLAYLSLFWGLAFYLIAVALRGFPPLTVVWLRLLVGA